MFIESIEKFENWLGQAPAVDVVGVYIVLICTPFAAEAAPFPPIAPVPLPPAITTIVPSGFIL